MTRKVKVTEKSLVESFGKDNIFWVGHCNGQNALSRQNPIFYNAGVYGWNFDGYVIDDYLILTGYRCKRSYKRLAGLKYLEKLPDFVRISETNTNICPWYMLEKEDLQVLLRLVIKWQLMRQHDPKTYVSELKSAIIGAMDTIAKNRGFYFDRAGYERYFIAEENI